MVAAIDAAALLLAALLWNAELGAELFGLFLGVCILGALVLAASTPEQDIESLSRLHLGASLSLVAVMTRELPWPLFAILLFGMLLRPPGARRLPFLVPSLAALAGLALLGRADGEGIGLLLVVAGLSSVWLIVSREVLRSSTPGVLTRMAASFMLLVAVSSVIVRIAAWFPENAPLGTIRALALAALALGSLGTLGATRITTFLTALALSRAGLVLFAHLGGVAGTVPALIALAASGVSLLLLALALEKTDHVDDVSNLRSVPRRLVLTLGALSACSFPPFPGFFVVFPLSSAVLGRGESFSLLAAAALLFLLALGSMRLVARAWESGAPRTVETEIGITALGLAFAATWAFSIQPSRLVEIARAAASGVF
jgi:hypothetical protein